MIVVLPDGTRVLPSFETLGFLGYNLQEAKTGIVRQNLLDDHNEQYHRTQIASSQWRRKICESMRRTAENQKIRREQEEALPCKEKSKWHRCGECEQEAEDEEEVEVTTVIKPVKKRKLKETNQSVKEKVRELQYRGFTSRLSLTYDVYEMEGLLREISYAIRQHESVMKTPNLKFLAASNGRVQRLRTPPCTYFNMGNCNFAAVHLHQVNVQPGYNVPRVPERAHICAVCYGQSLQSPHRAARCPIIKELDKALKLHFAWEEGK